MITCIAIDDEPKALEVIARYCKKTSLVSLKATFREPVKAIEFLQREKVDLIFLDINMPDISGIQLLQTLSPRPLIMRWIICSSRLLLSVFWQRSIKLRQRLLQKIVW
jgi:two-component system LytT family response regulator